jgi:hypothetical protein
MADMSQWATPRIRAGLRLLLKQPSLNRSGGMHGDRQRRSG